MSVCPYARLSVCLSVPPTACLTVCGHNSVQNVNSKCKFQSIGNEANSDVSARFENYSDILIYIIYFFID